MKPELNIVIPLKYYEEIIENRDGVIQALGDMIATFRLATIELTELLQKHKIDHTQGPKYNTLMEVLHKHLRSGGPIKGFNLDGKLTIVE